MMGGRKVGMAMREPYEDGSVLYLDYININMLVVILYYGFIRCYHWGNRVKGVWDLSAVLFTT